MTDARDTPAKTFRERIAPADVAGEAGDHLARYAFAAHWAPGQRVADLCCGVGYGANLLAAAGATKVYAVDASPDAMREATLRYGNRMIEFLCADATSALSLPEVDLVVCFEGIEHVETPERLMENIVRWMAGNGVALVSTPNAAPYDGGHSGNPYHRHEFTREEFDRLLRRYFADVTMFFQWGFDTPHDADWSLASLVRLITPVRVKRLVRSMVRGAAARAERSSRPPASRLAIRYRPYPATYLSPPGLRVEPHTWLAVCAAPRKGIVPSGGGA